MLLSTIVPVYNTAPYLRKALDSIICQDIPGHEREVIVIDDGSRDGSETILDEYARRYPTLVKVRHITNGGVSAARNLGMSLAKGEYVHFMDSDDWLIEGSYHKLVECFLDNGERPDYLGFRSVTLDDRSRRSWVETGSTEGKIIFDGAATDYYRDGRFIWSTWMGWYRREAIKGLTFDSDLKIGEDIKFNLEFLKRRPYFRLTDCVLYRYEARSASSVTQRNPSAMPGIVEGYLKIHDLIADLRKQFPEIDSGLTQVAASQLIPLTTRMLTARFTISEVKAIRDYLRAARSLPATSPGYLYRLINAIYSLPALYPLLFLLCRRVFIPHILPRISRN